MIVRKKCGKNRRLYSINNAEEKTLKTDVIKSERIIGEIIVKIEKEVGKKMQQKKIQKRITYLNINN